MEVDARYFLRYLARKCRDNILQGEVIVRLKQINVAGLQRRVQALNVPWLMRRMLVRLPYDAANKVKVLNNRLHIFVGAVQNFYFNSIEDSDGRRYNPLKARL